MTPLGEVRSMIPDVQQDERFKQAAAATKPTATLAQET
jgi:hypothetical protein